MRLTLAFPLAFCIGVLTANSVVAATQFKTFKAVMEELNDYGPAYNGLQIKSEKPLSFALVHEAYPKDSDDLKVEYAQITFIYGVYRAFCHLDVSEIKITSTVGYGPIPAKLRPDPAFAIKATVTRSQAMVALAEVFPAPSGCDDIIGPFDLGGVSVPDGWTEPFALFKSKKANQDRLMKAFRAQGVRFQ